MIHQEKLQVPMQEFSHPDVIDKIVEDLRKRGYRLTFRREAPCLRCIELNCQITPECFNVDEYYHFADASNTDTERILYAVSSIQGLKGWLVDACFVYGDNIRGELAKKLKWVYH